MELLDFINEAANSTSKWVAIEIVTKGAFYDSKDVRSQRVVSVDTYNEMKEKGRTKSHTKIVSLNTLGPVCSNKDEAMSYLDKVEKKSRKSKINKGNADYIVWCMNIGKANTSGKSKYDYNYYEEFGEDAEMYLGSWSYGILIGAKGSLKVGDKIFCVDNDTQKKLSGCPPEVKYVCKCSKEAFTEMFRKEFASVCKKPTRAFGKISDGLPWARMGQVYSIKGVSDEG